MDVVRWEMVTGVGEGKWNGGAAPSSRSSMKEASALLSALYHRCCPAVSARLSISILLSRRLDGQREKEGEKRGLEGRQSYTSRRAVASGCEEQTSGGGYLIKGGTSSN